MTFSTQHTLRSFETELARRFGNKWTETPVVLLTGDAAHVPHLAWNATLQRVEIRPGRKLP